jgi:hypothetical protein
MKNPSRSSLVHRAQVSYWALPCMIACAAHCGSDSNGTGSGGSSGATAVAGSAGSGGAAGSAGAAGAGGQAATLHTPWDYTGIFGTGQSLSVGEPGNDARGTPAAAPRLTTQPFHNLQLSTGSLPWPVDSNDPTLALIPLVEPIGRPSTAYPSSWPTNIAGETGHAAMANQLSVLALAAGLGSAGGDSGVNDYVTVHGAVGENGQPLSFLKKGAVQMDVRGHAFEATLIEARAVTRLAQAAGKTYGVGAITVTHGESDAGNTEYEAQLRQLWVDYNTDLSAITGQTEPPLMIVSQQNSSNDRSPSTLAEWRIGVDYPNDIVCSGPKYQYPYRPDTLHLTVEGYETLFEKYAQIYFERVVKQADWQPLQPTTVEREGQVISVHFHVPVPPLVWEDTFPAPHQAALTEWAAGNGFEVRAGATNVSITAVAIDGDTVRITCGADLPATGVTVGYAMTADPVVAPATTSTPRATPSPGTVRWGKLRDSDPFVGSTTQLVQPNFAVAFELPVP